VLLILVGLIGFVATGSQHATALIPAGFGLFLAMLGALSFKDRLRKHTMHAAALLGLVGFLGSGFMGFPKLLTLLGGGEVARPIAVVSQSVTAVLCAVFVGLCINSFLQARRRRAAAAGSPSDA
jgi:hypothetical protein